MFIDLEVASLNLAGVMERTAKTHNLSPHGAEVAESLYRQYLTIRRRYPDETLVPPEIVDWVWHHHILDTRNYHRDCDALFGGYLHHTPSGSQEKRERSDEDAWRKTRSMFVEEFGVDLAILAESGCQSDPIPFELSRCKATPFPDDGEVPVRRGDCRATPFPAEANDMPFRRRSACRAWPYPENGGEDVALRMAGCKASPYPGEDEAEVFRHPSNCKATPFPEPLFRKKPIAASIGTCDVTPYPLHSRRFFRADCDCD